MGDRLGRPQGAVSFLLLATNVWRTLGPCSNSFWPRTGAAFLLLLGLLALGMASFTEGETRKSSVPAGASGDFAKELPGSAMDLEIVLCV